MKKQAELEITEPDELKEIAPVAPAMNLNLPVAKTEEEGVAKLISDEKLVGVYDDIMKKANDDRDEISDLLNKMVDMVINEGDSTTSTKEAVVNLLKLKADQSDKMTKIADLMTRVKLKERDTFPKYFAPSQTNINVGDGGQKRALLEALAKSQKKENHD